MSKGEQTFLDINPLKTVWTIPLYILDDSNFDLRYVRLCDFDICGVWSGSALFANYPFRGRQSTMG